ncbi:peptide deformylase [Streptomyces sp. NPDC101225]|uniref:peptide deformylase n=1 Tax=Streptomyces sp. NPDC101225 TaxID=3366135 RepID=UPI00381285BA
MPSVFLQGRPVESYPRLAPEARRGSVRRITEAGEEVLHKPCRDVTEFGPDLAALIDDMFLTMYVAEGAGLAANQVGVGLRLFVYDCADDEGVRHVGHVVNPVLDTLAPAGRRLLDDGEGCLSVPGALMDVARPDRAVVRGLDRHGEPVAVEGTGYFARCLEHETDHCDGRLYLDRLSARGRKDALRQAADRREEVFARRAANVEALGR